jgi:hypothetical protein
VEGFKGLGKLESLEKLERLGKIGEFWKILESFGNLIGKYWKTEIRG